MLKAAYAGGGGGVKKNIQVYELSSFVYITSPYPRLVPDN
jgi:hypothetical protein